MTPLEKVEDFLLALYTQTETPAQISLTRLAHHKKVSPSLPTVLKDRGIIEQNSNFTTWLYKGRIDENFCRKILSWVNEYHREKTRLQKKSVLTLRIEQLERIEQKLDTILKHLNINQ